MKLRQIRDDYLETSGKVSDLCRQYAFAGIATIWVLSTSNEQEAAFLDKLLVPLLIFAISLFLDFSQYLYKTVMLDIVNRRNWKRTKDNEAEVPYSDSINTPSNVLFYAKVASTALGYVSLLWYIAHQIK